MRNERNDCSLKIDYAARVREYLYYEKKCTTTIKTEATNLARESIFLTDGIVIGKIDLYTERGKVYIIIAKNARDLYTTYHIYSRILHTHHMESGQTQGCRYAHVSPRECAQQIGT